MPDLDSGARAAEGNPVLQPHWEIAERNAGPTGSIALDNGRVRLEVAPEAGAKIVSLVRIESGREFMLQQDPALRDPCPKPRQFEHHAYGFDECFPSISACEYPQDAFQGVPLPDHGDLWSVPWKHRVNHDCVEVAVESRCLPCIFRKRIGLEANSVVLAYQLVSVTDKPFCYLWSAHPLLQIEPGCRIVLGQDVRSVLVESSARGQFTPPGDRCAWPVARVSAGGEFDLSVIGDGTAGTAVKLFTARLREGSGAVYYPKTDESISFHFDPMLIPYLGIWICEGGWPAAGGGRFTAALEPCTSSSDSLAQAIANGGCATLRPYEKRHWALRIQVQSGLPHELTQRLSQ